MDDLINRQDAINSLEEERCPCESEYDQGYLSMLDKAIWIIKEWLPSAQPEQQWVPCSEGPPKEESEVLVTTSWNDVCKAWYSNGKWRAEFINEYDDGEILAWMPLPKSYLKDGD